MTKSEQKILKALGWGNPPVKSFELRKAVGLSMRGFRLVTRRMEERNLIKLSSSCVTGVLVELTFAGHKLKENLAI